MMGEPQLSFALSMRPMVELHASFTADATGTGSPFSSGRFDTFAPILPCYLRCVFS